MLTNEFVIVTDSVSDLNKEIAKEFDIRIIPMKYNFGDGKEYCDSIDLDKFSILQFYKKIESGLTSKTSAVSISNFIDFVEPILNENKKVLVIGFSSALSSSYFNYVIGAKQLNNFYGEGSVQVIDSLSVSCGEGLLCLLTALERKKGKNIDECYKFVEETKYKICHYFTVGNLNSFLKSGKLTASKALMGTILHLKPIIHVDNDGRLVPIARKFGLKQSYLEVLKHLKNEIADDSFIFLSYGDIPMAYINSIKSYLRKKYPNNKILFGNYCGPVIASHCGESVFAIYFLGGKR